MREFGLLRFHFALVIVLGVIGSSSAGTSPALSISVDYIQAPLFKGIEHNAAVRLRVYVPAEQPMDFRSVNLALDKQGVDVLERLEVFRSKKFESTFGSGESVGSAAVSDEVSVPVSVTAAPGLTYLWVAVRVKADADIDSRPIIRVKGLTDDRGRAYAVDGDEGGHTYRMGIAVRKGGDDNVHTYRIPGLVMTDQGTLFAVYDIRHKNSGDLPGDIDVGMSRSTDGGRTWEPMKTIMDMGPPHDNNGIGDPSILFDPKTKTIWVAALWSKGNRSIAGSGPGLTPDETGQFMLVSSRDDGRTWSEPYSITAQVKNPAWHIYFPGPGSGIALEDGTLVFPSQYWDESRKPGIPHSAIIYSKDHGKTWRSGAGAKPNTTEAQVIETQSGVLMLNMRDNRGGFRSVATTTDLGATWVEHPTSRQALIDPTCMASFIKAEVRTAAGSREVVFFSNVADPARRVNTTVKASLDLGESWLPENALLVDERRTYGYSSLAQIDENTLGLLYEGRGEMFFVRVPVRDVVH